MSVLASKASTDVGPTREQVLVEPQWLQEHLLDAGVRVVEVDASSAAYREGHIAGAVLWNVYTDLKDASYRPRDAAAFEDLLARSGIDRGSTVVFYGYAPAMGLWLMTLYGHADVRILNCSRETWHGAGRPWSQDPPAIARSRYLVPAEDDRVRAHLPAVQAAIDDPTCSIVDVRTAAEYCGERFWPSGGLEEGGRAGHIPTAMHLPIEGVFDERGAFRSASDLDLIFAPIGPPGAGEVITYCTVGGRASTAWFVLSHLLGRDSVRVYDGSWAEWGRMPSTPVVSG